MTQPGGSAMIYGVLYQLLGTAHWAGIIQLRTSTDGDEWAEARLVVEPSGGGGDTQISSPRRRIVEQWKAKSDGGAWSLHKVVTEVFPDLYRAIDLATEKQETEFRFVTEGHRGRWAAAEQFFAELRGSTVSDNPLAALDDMETFKFFPKEEHTKRAFFCCILKELREHPDIAKDSEIECVKKLWYLLGRFVAHWDRTLEKVTRELNGFLRPLVDYSEQVESKRRELCAALLELASDGNAIFTPQELLAKVNLDHVSFCKWAKARDLLWDTTKRTIQRRWRYCAEVDVRLPMSLPEDGCVCVLTGESGQGKTWRLASLAQKILTDGSAMVAVSATGDHKHDLQDAANTVWRNAFGREGPTDIELVAKKRRDFLPELPTPWLTVCVDDVQSIQEAKSLVEQEWSSWGIRLALTVPPPVAQALKTQFGQDIAVVEIDDFNVLELQQYLKSNGHNWGMLPPDVRTILRRPLLAKLYCDIAEEENWHPTNEYALFSRYWQRIRDDRDQADHPGDIDAMRQLASTFLRDDVVYPWSQSKCAGCGVSPEVQKRLESVGWLRRLEDNRVEVTHDRLLNWAIAEAIVAKRISQELSTDDVANCVAKFFDSPTRSSQERMLAYVPMDACWLMGELGGNLAGELATVISALEGGVSIWRSESLYKESLPTLGPRIIRPIVERIRAAAGKDERLDDSGLLSRFLSDATIQIGNQHPDDAADWGRRMLEDECDTIRQSGLFVLKHFPNTAVLDRLWELHKINHDKSKRKESEHYWIDRKYTFAAMKSCVRLNSEWLERQVIQSEEESEPFSQLAYLVANLRGETGTALWNRVKATLFAKVPTDNPRCLVTCIQQHADSAEISRLESWLDHEGDLTRESALSALVDLAPKKALASLRRLNPKALYPIRTWWRPGLLLRFPNETRDQIREIIETSGQSRWQGALVYQDDPNQMDEKTLNLLLDELEVLARDANNRSATAKKVGFHVHLALLASVTRLNLLSQFETRAGTALERELTDLAYSWGGRMTLCVDHELEYATRILMKIAGEGLTKIVNMQLSSTSKFARLDGIKLSMIRPDSETRQLLTGITQLPDPWDENGQSLLLQDEAAVALAAIGENRAVVDALMSLGMVSRELSNMRKGQPPITDNDLTGAIEALNGPDENRRTNAVFALSVSGRVDYAPRIRQMLKAADPESKLALAAVMALSRFGDSQPEAMSLLEMQLEVPNHAHAASLALLSNGKSESLKILEQAFLRRGVTLESTAGNILAINLAMRKETRKTVAEVLWKSIQENKKPCLDMAYLLGCLAEIDSPEILEFLIEQAHAPSQGMHIVGQKAAAIRALAEVDRDSAFRAAETAFYVDHKELELYPDVLIEIDETRAVPVLFDAYSRNLSAIAKWAIGRALRYIGDQTVVHSRLGQMVRSDSEETRVIGVELSGWQSPNVFGTIIRQIAIADPVVDVRRKAELSAALLERQQFAIDLLQVLEKTHGSRCWSYLGAVVDLCDPWLLTTRGDPLFLWDRLAGKPPGLKKHASDLIEKRIKHVKDEADKVDRASGE